MQQIKVLSFKKTNFIENTSHFIKKRNINFLLKLIKILYLCSKSNK